MAKVESLHGTTPAEIFQSGLENLSEIETIALSVLWKDGRVTTGWSSTDEMGKLALMILALDERQRMVNFRMGDP